MATGHNAGDLLQADQWRVLEEHEGFLRIEASLPPHLLNPRGQLFGGFTPTYVDLLSIFTVRAGPGRLDPEHPRGWVSTINMRIDYFEPVIGPTFEMTGNVEHTRGKTRLISMKMFDADKLAVHALTTLRVLDELE